MRIRSFVLLICILLEMDSAREGSILFEKNISDSKLMLRPDIILAEFIEDVMNGGDIFNISLGK